jgi:glucans biosynthesis protein
MTGKLLDRRSVLGQAAAATYALAAAKWALAVSAAQAEGESPRPAGPAGIVFSPNTVKTEAKRLSDQPFSKPAMELPKPFDKLSYDQ